MNQCKAQEFVTQVMTIFILPHFHFEMSVKIWTSFNQGCGILSSLSFSAGLLSRLTGLIATDSQGLEGRLHGDSWHAQVPETVLFQTKEGSKRKRKETSLPLKSKHPLAWAAVSQANVSAVDQTAEAFQNFTRAFLLCFSSLFSFLRNSYLLRGQSRLAGRFPSFWKKSFMKL